MNKLELELAQHFKHVHDRAVALAEKLDPHRTNQGELVGTLVGEYQAASRAFWRLTGRDPDSVPLTELSTVDPSPWAKAYDPQLEPPPKAARRKK